MRSGAAGDNARGMPRRSTRFLVYWTVLCAVPAVWLVARAAASVSPGCREWCGLDVQVAGTLIPIIVVIWVAVIALVLFVGRSR